MDSRRRADRAADARSSRVSWLTPRTWALWQDVGLRGLGPDGTPVPGWDGRTELRNTSMDKKYGLTAADRRDFAQLYGDP
ncbi:hypothetical protein [Streptomyces clavifer]|uniref:hypothetical protein n=1 Tax=Streptomyces clavifer TaxID=68188 RepID=UPI00352C478B